MHTSNVDITPKVYFLDLEVDSVPVDRGEPRQCITQICVYDPEREKGKRVFNAYVKPPKQLRRKEQKIDFGPKKEQVSRHKFNKVWPYLKEWVNEGLEGNRFAVIVGHNIYKHDWVILENECARIQEGLPKYWRPFCTLYLAGSLGVPKGEQSLASLCQKYQVKHERQHEAMNDVKMLVKVFSKMIGSADFKKIANAMALPPSSHPVREVASIIRENCEAILVVFDFESTGLFPKEGEPGENPRATELAAYMPSKDATFSSLIDPGLDEGITLSNKVVELTGITEKLIRAAGDEYKAKTGNPMNFKAVWQNFEEWMNKEIGDTTNKVIALCGHNIWGYDIPLYKSESERFGMKVKEWKSLDTLALSKHLYKGATPQPQGFHKLQEIRRRMGIDENNAHRALGDVIVNYKVFQKFVQGVDEKKLSSAILSGHPILSIGQLVREEGGTFNPQNYMTVPNGAVGVNFPGVLPPNPAPQANPFVGDFKKKEAVPSPSPSPSPYPNPHPLPFTAVDKTFNQGVPFSALPAAIQPSKPKDDRAAAPLLPERIPFEAPVVALKERPDGMEYTFTFSFPKGEKRAPEVLLQPSIAKNSILAPVQVSKKPKFTKNSVPPKFQGRIQFEKKPSPATAQIIDDDDDMMEGSTKIKAKKKFTLEFSE